MGAMPSPIFQAVTVTFTGSREAPRLVSIKPTASRREWGALAVAAARRAGLAEPDIAALRRHLDDQLALDDDEEVALKG